MSKNIEWIATALFAVAILHTFAVSRFQSWLVNFAMDLLAKIFSISLEKLKLSWLMGRNFCRLLSVGPRSAGDIGISELVKLHRTGVCLCHHDSLFDTTDFKSSGARHRRVGARFKNRCLMVFHFTWWRLLVDLCSAVLSLSRPL